MTTTKTVHRPLARSVLPRGWRVSVRSSKGADITNYYAVLFGPNDQIRIVQPPDIVYWLTRSEAKREGIKAAIEFERQNNPR